MKVLIGTFSTDHGTAETTPQGLVYAGDESEKVQSIVESVREWYDRSGIKYRLGDEELVRSLPYRLQEYILWTVYVDEATGLTVDQPAYDPWGEVWRSRSGFMVLHLPRMVPLTQDAVRTR